MGASLKKLLIRNKKFYNGVVDIYDDADAYRDMVLYVDHALQTTQKSYTQTKKKRPILMVLYFLIQLRCRNKYKTKMFIKRLTHKIGNYLILSSYLEGLLNLMCTQLFPSPAGS